MNAQHLAWKRLYQTAHRHGVAVHSNESSNFPWKIVGGGYTHGVGQTAVGAWRNACEGQFGEQHLQAFRQGSYRP